MGSFAYFTLINRSHRRNVSNPYTSKYPGHHELSSPVRGVHKDSSDHQHDRSHNQGVFASDALCRERRHNSSDDCANIVQRRECPDYSTSARHYFIGRLNVSVVSSFETDRMRVTNP